MEAGEVGATATPHGDEAQETKAQAQRHTAQGERGAMSESEERVRTQLREAVRASEPATSGARAPTRSPMARPRCNKEYNLRCRKF